MYIGEENRKLCRPHAPDVARPCRRVHGKRALRCPICRGKPATLSTTLGVRHAHLLCQPGLSRSRRADLCLQCRLSDVSTHSIGRQRNPNLPRAELTLADFEAIVSAGPARRTKQFLFCGNYGDALVARHLPIVNTCGRQIPAANRAGHTTGPGRDAVFWKKLASWRPPSAFSIDGLETNRAVAGAVQAGIASAGGVRRRIWGQVVGPSGTFGLSPRTHVRGQRWLESELRRSTSSAAAVLGRRSCRAISGWAATARFYYLELPGRPSTKTVALSDLSRLTGAKGYGDYQLDAASHARRLR